MLMRHGKEMKTDDNQCRQLAVEYGGNIGGKKSYGKITGSDRVHNASYDEDRTTETRK